MMMDDVDLIDLAQDKDNWRAVMNMVIKLQILQNARNLTR
jgi:hypothetical protein